MNGLTLIGIAIVVFAAAYLGYGRWLVKTWGIDPQAKTPAVEFEDGQDYSPASRFTVFSHQFSSTRQNPSAPGEERQYYSSSTFTTS